MKAHHHTHFTRGGVNQIDQRPTVTLFIPEGSENKEEMPDHRPVSAQVLKREKPKAIRSKYQRG